MTARVIDSLIDPLVRMDEHAPFLDAIRANPNDMLHRLVYADWLDERGDPRAEFLRIDCQWHERMAELVRSRKLADRDLRRLTAALSAIAPSLDPSWVATFTSLRPVYVACSRCRTVLSARDAIDTNPRTYRKMKSSRYCKSCYEWVVASSLRGGGTGGGYSRPSSDD